jgi:hypothetical protein
MVDQDSSRLIDDSPHWAADGNLGFEKSFVTPYFVRRQKIHMDDRFPHPTLDLGPCGFVDGYQFAERPFHLRRMVFLNGHIFRVVRFSMRLA